MLTMLVNNSHPDFESFLFVYLFVVRTTRALVSINLFVVFGYLLIPLHLLRVMHCHI